MSPSHSLRSVPVAEATGPRAPGRRSPVAELRRRDHQVRHAVLEVRTWGLGCGRSCASDALTVVVGATLDCARAGVRSPRRWTADRVRSLLGGELHGWCAAKGVPLPGGLAGAVDLWLTFLHAHGALADGSDTLGVLRTAVTGVRRPTSGGTSRPGAHPAGRRR